MNKLIVFALLLMAQLPALAQMVKERPTAYGNCDYIQEIQTERCSMVQRHVGNLIHQVELEKIALNQLNDGADNMLNPECQATVRTLLETVNAMDVMKTPMNQQTELQKNLKQVSETRAALIRNIDSCLVKEN